MIRSCARKRRTVATYLFLALGLLLSIRPAYSGASHWIDIKIENGQMYLESEIAGIKGYSIIDTGAQFNAINDRFITSNGLTFKKGKSYKVYGAISEQNRASYNEVPVTVLGAKINFKQLVSFDMGSPDVHLILGAAFLKRYVFQFDYPNNRMRLMTRDSVDLKKIKNVKSKRDRYGGSPLVRVALNDKQNAWLIMDTGMSGGLIIDRDLGRKLNWIEKYKSESLDIRGVISTAPIDEFRGPDIKLGDFTIENTLVWLPAEGENFSMFETYTPLGTRIAAKNSYQGVLGFDILQHFVVTIDYKTGYMHFYPGEKLPESEQE